MPEDSKRLHVGKRHRLEFASARRGAATHKVTAFEALVRTAKETYGPVDILVNNAGLMLFSFWEARAIADR